MDWGALPKHKLSEDIVDLLCIKTQNANPKFFRILTAYQLATMASMMRTYVITKDRGNIPVNLYAISLAESGQGKGHSTNIFNEALVTDFYSTFISTTLPSIQEKSLSSLALKRSKISGETEEDEYEAALREYRSTGEFITYFDSGTAPAYKQYRHKLLMARIGSLNFVMDEIGSNLTGNTDLLNTYLETFDKGLINQKLIKNTSDSTRLKEIRGGVPSNFMGYGTPTKLLDGSTTEKEYMSFLETGFARRCFFGYSKNLIRNHKMTAEEKYDQLISTGLSTQTTRIQQALNGLSSIAYYEKGIPLERAEAIELMEYKGHCEAVADTFGDHEAIHKAEMSHRYFKALKLAGAYAFVDNTPTITMEGLHAAISLTEESGKAFSEILAREKSHVKIAKYIVAVKKPVTHVDLLDEVPCFKGSIPQRKELLLLASTWAYQNDIIMSSKTMQGIEFIQAEQLETTDLNKLILSISTDITYGYATAIGKFDKMHKLCTAQDMHWINHALTNGHREDPNIIPGFNMLVLDIDGGDTLDAVRGILKDYIYFMHTTKRHTIDAHRFRVILPLSHTLKLDAKEYLRCINNVLEQLPIAVDTQTTQRARKWASTANSQYWYNTDGELFDIRPFIPNTPRNEERVNNLKNLKDVTNIERWFLQQVGELKEATP